LLSSYGKSTMAKRQIPRIYKHGRAKPSLWAKYTTGDLILKTLKTEYPVYFYEKLCTTRYTTRRRRNKYLFYDKSQTKNVFQSIENSIMAIFNDLDFDFSNAMTDDCIREYL